MLELMAEREARPFYGQVVAQDAETADIPDWESGDEQAVASEHAVLVATRPEHEGDVHIQVLRGEGRPERGSRVFDGELSVVSGRVVVGSVLAGQTLEVKTGRGWLRVRENIRPTR